VIRPKPACPRHPDSTVWFDGRYGKPGHKRQRYICIPPNGDKRHRFTETLPRLHGGTGECLECERNYEAHEGPPTGRKFHYSTRDIAFALAEVGKGISDRRVGLEVRRRAERLKHGKRPRSLGRRSNDDGNTIADWVELYAPAIFETLKPTRWPEIVAFDSQPFAIRRLGATGARALGGQVVLNVLAAYGWENYAEGDEKGKLIALRAYPNFGFNQGFPHWLHFFHYLQGELGPAPRQIVCDQDRELLRALDRAWPPGQKGSPWRFICHWHLSEGVRKILVAAKVPPSHALHETIKHERNKVCTCAFCDEMSFITFEHLARAQAISKLDSWLNRNTKLVLWQLAHRWKPRRARITVGGLEKQLTEVKGAYLNRAGMLHNRERMNRRLMLMQLYLNHEASISHYSKVIRDELLANGGFGGERYLVDDRLSVSSLQTY
jgi:hypothetical protein